MNGFLGPAATLVATLGAATPGSPTLPGDTLALPRSKVNLDACFQAANARHPGRLERVRVLHRGEGFYVRIETREGADREWLQICSLASGLVVSEQRLIDVVP